MMYLLYHQDVLLASDVHVYIQNLDYGLMDPDWGMVINPFVEVDIGSLRTRESFWDNHSPHSLTMARIFFSNLPYSNPERAQSNESLFQWDLTKFDLFGCYILYEFL